MSARSNTAVWILGAATVAAMVVGSRRSARRSAKSTSRTPTPEHGEGTGPRPGTRPPAPDGDVEFGAAVFPPPRVDKDWDRMRTLAAAAERETGMRNLYSFLLAAARTESAGRASAMNTATDMSFSIIAGSAPPPASSAMIALTWKARQQRTKNEDRPLWMWSASRRPCERWSASRQVHGRTAVGARRCTAASDRRRR